MKFELKPTTQRAGISGGVIAAAIQVLSFIIGIIPFLACLVAPIAILIGLLLPLGIGYYSVMLGRKAGAVQETAQDAVDGGIAGAIAAIIGGVVGVIFSLIGAIFNIGVSASNATDAAGSAAVIGVALIGGLCVGVIGSLVFGGVLGAIGGAVYGLMNKNQGGAMAPRM